MENENDNNNHENTTTINVVSSKEIKTLDVLTYSNICACENFIRSTGANHQTLPIMSWMSDHTIRNLS